VDSFISAISAVNFLLNMKFIKTLSQVISVPDRQYGSIVCNSKNTWNGTDCSWRCVCWQNSPNDLQMLSDAPAHHIFCLLGPCHPKSNQLPQILCVIQVLIQHNCQLFGHCI